jgi:hypothetical protein
MDLLDLLEAQANQEQAALLELRASLDLLELVE